MDKVKRIIFSIISIAIFITVTCLNIKTKDNILFLLITSFSFNILAIFVTENFFTKPTDVIATSFSIILMIFPILFEEQNDIFIWLFLIESIICCALIIISLISLLISNQNKSPETRCNKIAANCKSIACTLGKTKWLYTITYSIFIIRYFNEIEKNPYILLILLIILMIMNTINFNNLKLLKNKKILCSIGTIKSLEKDRIIIAELYKDKNIDIKDIVKYIDIDNNKIINYGIVLEKFNDLEKQLIKIINIKTETLDNNNKLKLGYIYNCNDETNNEEINDIISRIVGIVTSGTSIDTIKFRYININNLDLEEGNLLELKINDNNNKVYYQIINAVDNIEKLENDNTHGYIIGEAIQLGKLEEKEMIFEKYGWVPNINTVVCKVEKDVLNDNDNSQNSNSDDIQNNNEFKILNDAAEKTQSHECNIGNILNTNIPINLDLENSLNHHIAILGVTGTGKTTLVTKILIPEMEKIEEHYTIIFDITGEYEKKIDNDKIYNLEIYNLFINVCIKEKNYNLNISDLINYLYNLNVGEYGRKDYKEINRIKNIIINNLKNKISCFLDSNKKIMLIGFDFISNSEDSLSYFSFLFDAIFKEMKDRHSKLSNKKLTIILEEAHTLIPEWNLIGGTNDTKISQAIVNKVGQISLQGRKYNTGLIVISQRTASVSKTILTQCNTIITFKSFDKTSEDFLSSHLPEHLIKIIPNLGFRQALVTGKGLKNNTPLICEIKNMKKEKQK